MTSKELDEQIDSLGKWIDDSGNTNYIGMNDDIKQLISDVVEELLPERRPGVQPDDDAGYWCKECNGYDECDCNGFNEALDIIRTNKAKLLGEL